MDMHPALRAVPDSVPADSFTPLAEDAVLLRRIVDAVPDAVLVFDAGTRIVLANAACSPIFGRRPPALALQRMDVVLAHEHRADFEEFCADYFAAPATVSLGSGPTWQFVRRDGTTFTADVSVTPVRAAGRLLAIAAIRPRA